MAGDWIKMRTCLGTHPAVVRIMSALKADRLRVVGGLFAVWCLFDAHSEDGSLSGYTLEAVDDLIGWPGFAAAMTGAGWLVSDESGIAAVDFEEHNGQSAKRRAMESDRKRRERAEKEVSHDGRKSSACDADGKRTREEKRREEKNKEDKDKEHKAPPAGDAELFPDVDPQVVADFKALRKKKRAEITKTAMNDIAAEAVKAGMSLEQAMRVCCSRGWTGFNADWVAQRGTDRRAGDRRGSPERRESRHSGFDDIDYSEGIENGRII